MDLRDYLNIFWRRKWVILCTFLVTVAVVIVVTFKTTPMYIASTMLRIATYTTGTVNYLDYTYASRLTNTYVKLATTKPVLDELQNRLELNYLPTIAVSIVGETELLQIKVENQDPELAAKIANTFADILVSQSVELYTGGGQSSLDILKEQLDAMEVQLNQAREEYIDLVAKDPKDDAAIETAKLSFEYQQDIYSQMLDQYEQSRVNAAIREKSIYIVEPATAPASPSRPNVPRNIALGVMVGLIGGVGLAFLFENLDTTLYSTEQIEKVTKLPILGSVPNTDVREQLISMNGNTAYIDAFHRLRSNLFALHKDSPFQAILVTSSMPGEGKSTLVINLAYVLAQAGRKVIVIDCDLRRPTLDKFFKLPNEQGLSNILAEEKDLEAVLQDSTVSGVKVITSGPIPSNQTELLGSQQMSTLINRLREYCDAVVLDSPPIISVSDSIMLAPIVDGVILVVSRLASHKKELLSACKQLADVRARILGVVVNRAEQNRGYYYDKSKRIG